MTEPVEFIPRGSMVYESVRLRLAVLLAIQPAVAALTKVVRAMNDLLTK